MIRFLFYCLFYTTVARWGYNEITNMFPFATPYLNQAIQTIQIPTHDQWSANAIQSYVQEAKYALLDAKETLENFKESLKEVKRG